MAHADSGPPAGVPAGPPAGVPAGPPAGPPAGVPARPPAGVPASPPAAGPAGRSVIVNVHGFPLALDRLYHAATHMWVQLSGPRRARIGMDPLGIETSGTLAQISLPPAAAELVAGRPFGQLEAAKFVGPLVSPVSGSVLTANEALTADPGIAERDPFGAGWLIEAQLSNPVGELSALLSDPGEITRWFAAKIGDYRREGVIAQ